MGRKARLKEHKRKHRQQQEDKIVAAYYNRNPDVFLEHNTGIKLNWFQRKWVRFKSKVGGWFASSK
jgi:hypothetical protein